MSKQSIPAWVDESWDEYRTIIELWSEQSGLPADKQCAHVIARNFGKKERMAILLTDAGVGQNDSKGPRLQEPRRPKNGGDYQAAHTNRAFGHLVEFQVAILRCN